MTSFELDIPNRGVSIWCEMPLLGKDRLLVGVVYRSPSSSINENEHIVQLIQKAVQMNTSHVIIFGDFNYPEIQWDNQTVEAANDHPSQYFMECIQDCYLYQHVNESTHHRALQRANILDLVLTNEEGMVENLTYSEPVGKSHHVMLEWNMKLYTAKPLLSTDEKKYRYDHGNYNEMRSMLGEVDWIGILHDKTVDEMWKQIQEKIMEAVKSHVPASRARRLEDGPYRQRKKPLWMNENVLAKLRKKKTAYSRYLQTKEGKDYLEYVKARNTAKLELRKAIRDYEAEIAKQAKRNPKAFYRYINSKLKTKTGIADLKDTDGKTVVDSDEKADMFNTFFSSVFTNEDLNNLPNSLPSGAYKELNKIVFNEEDVTKLLREVNPNKSPGPDNIHPRVLKECAEVLSAPLYYLFKSSLKAGEIPQDWKDGNISPVYKKGSRAQVENYRPISLTSVVCKILEKVVRKALLNHLFENEILANSQHGFIYGRSCMTQLLQVFDKLTEMLDQGDNIDVIYMDLAKAFDTVPHQRLLVKLQSYGVRDEVLKWVGNFLDQRRQRVLMAGTCSKWNPVTSGIPQGSVLGPILFIYYINDMPESITSLIYIYADDTKLVRKVNDSDDSSALQRDLETANEWTKLWQLKFNISKCKVMHLGINNREHDYAIVENGQHKQLEKSAVEKDLGVWMDSKMNFAVHVGSAVSRANQIVGLIKRSFTCHDRDTMKRLITSMVRPHLEYGNIIWYPHLKKDTNLIENVQRRATKLIPELKSMSYESRLRILDLPSLVYRRYRGDVIEAYKYLHNLYTVESDRILPRVADTGYSTRGHSFKLIKRRCSSKLRQNFFGYRVVNAWNSLPEQVVTAPNINVFKRRLDRHWINLRFTMDNKFFDY